MIIGYAFVGNVSQEHEANRSKTAKQIIKVLIDRNRVKVVPLFVVP